MCGSEGTLPICVGVREPYPIFVGVREPYHMCGSEGSYHE